MVESIEDAVQAVAGSKNEREQIQNVLREEISDLESSLESGFQRQRKQIERDLSKVEREVASETVDTEEIKDQLRDIDTVDDSAIEELKNSISRTQQLESKLDDKIEELENAKQTAAEASREEAGQQAAEVVEDELDRLHEQRSDLQAEINRLQMEREEIEEA
jgi:chromosome segregation ATPase